MRISSAVQVLAERQDQLFTRAQATDRGMSASALDRRLRSGELVAVHPSVYRIHPADDTFVRRCRAALLAAGRSSVVCRRAAAVLLGAPDIAQVVEIAIDPTRRLRLEGVTVVRVQGHLDFIQRYKGMNVHEHTRVVLDLAAVLDRDALELTLDHALLRRWFRIDELDHLFGLRAPRGRKGSAVLRELIDERAAGQSLTMSRFEQRLFATLRHHGLPMPVRQHRVRLASGGSRLLDFAYPAVKVYIEAESYEHHSSRRDWAKGKVRGNALAAMGWLRIDVTWTDLTERPEEVVAWVQATLASAEARSKRT